MDTTFFLYPADGKAFDIAALRQKLLSFEGVCEDPSDTDTFVVAESNAAALQVVKDIHANPDQTPWVVFLLVNSDVIHIYREATTEVLANFRPVLSFLLDQGVNQIETMQGDVLNVPRSQWLDLILAEDQ